MEKTSCNSIDLEVSPDTVLKQVEALFAALDGLPDEIRSQALNCIHSNLNRHEGTNDGQLVEKSSASAANSDDDDYRRNSTIESVHAQSSSANQEAKDDENEHNEEAAKNISVSMKVNLPIEFAEYTRRIATIGDKRLKVKYDENGASNPVDIVAAAPSTLNRKPRSTVRKKKVSVNDSTPIELETKKKLVKSKCVESGENNVENEDDCEVAKGTKARKSRRKPMSPQKIHREEQSDDIDDPSGYDEKKEEIPVNIYRVPTGITPSILKHSSEIQASDIDLKRVRGQRTFYGCTICDKKFYSRAQVVIHTRMHTGEKPHLCHICNKGFSQGGALKVHLKRHERTGNYSCSYCDYRSVGKIDVIRHEARHKKERNFSCEVCGRQFTTEPCLKNHIRHVHEKIAKFVCQICGFITHRQDNLRRHINIRHSNKEYMQCPVCQALIKQRSSFISHMRIHTGERPHSCTKCNKMFKSNSQLAAHMRTHLEGSFECQICKRKFKTRFHLKRHSLVHTGERPYSCFYCDYSCNVKGNINKHVRAVHGKIDFSFRAINAAMKAADEEEVELPDAESLKERGEAVCQDFLTRLSIRKDEQLTVEGLQKDLETMQKEHVLGHVRSFEIKRKRKPTVKQRRTAEVETGDEYEEEVIEIDREQEDESAAELLSLCVQQEAENQVRINESQTALIIPPDGYICVPPSGVIPENGIPVSLPLISPDEDKLATATVYLIRCKSESEA